MEDIMNFPYFREVESIRDVRYFGGYPKGSILPWREFQYSFYLFQICSF